MTSFEERATRVSFSGRFADEPTRRSVPVGAFHVAIQENRARPLYKEDGSFAFIDLEPRPSSYTISVRSRRYRDRELDANLPTVDAVSLARDGEDELYVSITAVNVSQKRVEFNSIPILRTIGEGAEVRGEGGVTASLQETLEGEDLDFAVLSTVATLAPGQALRIVRSDRHLLRAGPYYPFSEPASILPARLVDKSRSHQGNSRVAIERRRSGRRASTENSLAVVASVSELLCDPLGLDPNIGQHEVDLNEIGCKTPIDATKTDPRGDLETFNSGYSGAFPQSAPVGTVNLSQQDRMSNPKASCREELSCQSNQHIQACISKRSAVECEQSRELRPRSRHS